MTRRSLGEARRYLVAALALEVVLAPLGILRGRLLAGVGAICLGFFRDPERRLDPEPDTLYASADGVIVGIDTAPEPWLAGGDALRISTFLALYDVHVNRSPAPGRIARAESVPGSFAPAFLGRATDNHRKRLAIDDGPRRVVLVQIAGMVARRISSWAWEGDRVSPGDRIALIHFGSRAEVLVPAGSAEPLVAVGDRVRAGITPLARYVAPAPEAVTA
jgi:phosphatidylserine decarboxylase